MSASEIKIPRELALTSTGQVNMTVSIIGVTPSLKAFIYVLLRTLSNQYISFLDTPLSISVFDSAVICSYTKPLSTYPNKIC